ncbi:MAG: hypothetical protein E6K76_07055 [Candidatus Eisenbacteria bacterium]|uniref:Carboxymuconolactone decarboxylase-like domain-containing protein n=1 Tax=Eiseniibacteriota bacterium TaxID=2212470 RepID=A0A538T4V3_UNCEI|nr:MAG: hypothetical protein E6K76_07055 [Candidatus Eisenbacteria bacterium]
MAADPGKRARALRPPEARLVSLSAAIAAGDASGTADHAAEALREGAAPEAVYETLLQSYLFLGFPHAIEAFFAAKPVLARHGARPGPEKPANPSEWNHAGESLCRRVYGKNYVKLMETMRDLSPDLASWMILEGYGKTLSRPGLDTVTREYCIVAILATSRMWRQLRSHAIGAIHVGGTRAGVREAIELCAPMAGDAVVREALSAAGLESDDARS